MADLSARLAAKLREALEFFNDAPRFRLRRNPRRDSYQIATEIESLLREHGAGTPPAPGLPSDTAINPEPARFSDRRSFTALEVEGALCAWEWMMDNRGRSAVMEEWFDRVGSAGMRMCSQQAGAIASRVYAHMEEHGYEFVGSYDWEFVPEVMSRLDWGALCSDNQYSRGVYDPNAADLFVTMLSADLASTTDPGRRRFQRRDAA